ncbi:hypothetical protein Q3G72_031149 [Acer saccharum]|nr:hypothetical protein Q3G72_031149 [Acer saccharum]
MSGIEAILLAVTAGIAFQLLYDAIRHAKTKTRQFEDILTRLQNTVKLLAPKINEIDRLNKELENSHKEEIIAFVRQLVKAKELVFTCSEIPSWNLIKQYRYAERLDELDSSLQRLLNVEFQAAQCHDILKILAEQLGYVLLDVYQFNFSTIVSWAAISIVALLFLWGNLLRLLGKEPPDLPGLEISEQSTMEVANSCRGIVEEAVRWIFHVSVEREWIVFAQVVGGLLSLSCIGTFTDLLTFLYIGIAMGMTVPLIYVKYDDKIKRYSWGSGGESKEIV